MQYIHCRDEKRGDKAKYIEENKESLMNKIIMIND